MSEKIITLLFRLYPRAFRERYLHEALLLCRDRRLNEIGIYRRVRLVCDLLVDFFASLPIAWRASYPVVAVQSHEPSAQPVPSFHLLHAEPLRPASILLGSVFSIAAFGFFVLVLRTTALYPIERHALSPVESVLQRLNQPALPPPQNGDVQKTVGEISASTGSQQPLVLNKTASSSSQMQSAPSQIRPAHGDAPKSLLASPLPNDGHTGLATAGNPRANAATLVLGTPVSAVSAAPDERDGAASQEQVHPQDATRAMIQAISAHQIVMFGETHGNKQEYEWLCKLVKTPAFSHRVDDIVVEFGNSLYQKTVDRYIAGEDIPQAQVEKAWRNMIGAVGPISPVYGEFYKAVRDSNLHRRGGHQIRLLLGDPYGDWEKIQTREDLGPYLAHRDQWYAQVVHDDVLAKHHSALLIMGAGHFSRRNGPSLIERSVRDAGVQPYLVVFGTNAVGGYDDLDPRFEGWPVPSIVALRGTWVGSLPAMPVVSGGMIAPDSAKMADIADAMLYVGPRDSLTELFVPKSELIGTAYGKEVNRRLMIELGHSMEFTQEAESPQYQRPLQQIVSHGVHLLPPDSPKSASEPLPPRPPSQ